MWKSMLILSAALALLILLSVGTVYLAPVTCAAWDHTGTYAAGMLMKGCK
jgi:DMSO reductase anchor subunit